MLKHQEGIENVNTHILTLSLTFYNKASQSMSPCAFCMSYMNFKTPHAKMGMIAIWLDYG
jgi:hypothetical protein